MNLIILRKELFSLQDLAYRDFNAPLIPSVKKEDVIGIRVPILRKYAANLNDELREEFFLNLPHKYHEENNLHAFLIEKIKDFSSAIVRVEEFLPYVDNWATSDILNPKAFDKSPEMLLPYINKWLKSSHAYTVRYGIRMLMKYFIKDNFKIEYPYLVASIKTEEYYVKMMIAWYFATALSFRYEEILPFISEYRLPLWIHNKTISKAHDSYLITPLQKKELSSYRIKNNALKNEP